ncbi:HAD family phosphatase [Proteiniphilum sp. X52]|uniref:HAD family hydrolase n=1 Tax=Proteiniphilum sp. X52 TaxID=2382159 RepID=UPI000F0A60E2|nr:HAD hydrolase-like protein [Proteiniphilum sp. X52]RNC66288.1 HAD family hydrolase [Proteiniphilum sp. X52]
MRIPFLNYLKQNHYTGFDLKAVLFDMDGVLYDSMPAHARSWQETMEQRGYTSTTPEEFYFHEGRIGSSTIDIITEREFGRNATEEEIRDIYARKSALFAQYNQGEILPGIKEIIGCVKSRGLEPVLVTGSGQPSLLDRLDIHFPGVFTPQTMVTAFDVEHGKPDPEPYLMGLQKGGDLKPNQAIVIENAPLGIESAVGAGIFTIAVNTGPLPDSVLGDAGASVVFSSMEKLLERMPEILRLTQTISI